MGVIRSAKTRRWQVAGIACAILAMAGTGTLIASNLTGSNMFSDPGYYRNELAIRGITAVKQIMSYPQSQDLDTLVSNGYIKSVK